MPNDIRPRVTGASVSFTVALADRGSDLLVAEIDRLREAVRRVRAERPFGIAAWVVLPDPLHAVWTLPDGDGDHATRWASIKSRLSRDVPGGLLRASHVARREKAIWPRRFWEHHIRDEGDLSAHVRYCWANPVKHGLTARPMEWPHSSIHRNIRFGRVDAEWAGGAPDGDFGE